MRLLVFGAHPDDPESGCGGLAARCVQAGHEVVFLYATAFREGREFFGRPEKEVRTGEALAACDVLGVRGILLDYPHEGVDVNRENIARVTEKIAGENPDIVVAHWPVDTHPDHRTSAALALAAYIDAETTFGFYHFEVMTGQQSMHFHPTHYVDISEVAKLKHESLLCHKSQDGEAVWQSHELMHRFRGHECGAPRAEAYIRLDRRHTVQPGLPDLLVSSSV
ncbi:MAG: PIG-L deacetylase family protein [Candidatus Latescibacteria bacterium]|jgi:LmbE family N-acetylglucosaminyl deacetylase|nr:PIG-L deacetylase family protein [Candidatus Latescibacterota bacterium]